MSDTLTEAAKAATIRRISWRVLPFLMLCYLVAYLDRSNISIAALTMNADLGLTTAMYGLAAGLFFVSYTIFEIPSNLILARTGARIWIARIMVTWGIVAALMSLVGTAYHLYGMRLLLGAAEAGFTPGVIYFLSLWYPASERGRAMSFFYIGATLASVLGLPLSGALLQLDGTWGLAGWRWLFLLEGAPAVLLGIFVLFYLPNGPAVAKWLQPAEKQWLSATLAAEAAGRPVEEKHSWRPALRSGTVWLLALFWLLQAFGTIGVTLLLPLIVKSVSGQTNLNVSLLSALPFLLACVLMYVNGRHSDRTGERAMHLGLPLLASGILLAASVFAVQIGAMALAYALLVCSVGLNWASTPVFWATTTQHVTGIAAAASIALINSCAQFAGMGLPPLVGMIKDATGSFDAGVLMIAAALAIGGVLGLALGPKSQPSVTRAAVPLARV